MSASRSSFAVQRNREGTVRRLPAGQRAGPATRNGNVKVRLHWAVLLLICAWMMPFVIYLGPVRLTPYRIALLVLFVPCMIWVARGRAGHIRLPDTLLVLFALWCVASLASVNGPSIALQTGGIQVLETLTPYLLARCLIRNADDFYAFARVLTWIVIALLPFAISEAVTGRNLYLEVSGRLLPSIGVTEKELRWGLRRAQLFFEHPILMGVCCGNVLALAHLVANRDLAPGRKWMRSTATALTAALSLSSGPLSGLLVQVALMSWNRVFGWLARRWLILSVAVAMMVLAVELFAKRPLPNILLSFAFDPQSAFFRLLIWNHGTQSVANHVWFGVGMGSWDRPAWMGPSIDMFWLYNAVTYGLPAGALMLAFIVAATIGVGVVGGLDARHSDYRAAYLIGMVAFFVTGWMVHFWNSTYVFFLLMVGAGQWLRDAGPQPLARTMRGGGSMPVERQLADRALGKQLEPAEAEPSRR